MNPSTDNYDAQPEDPRLLRAAQEYLAELEAGRRPRRRDFIARHADIAVELVPYLEALDIFQTAAPKLKSSTPRPSLADPPPIEPLGDFRIERELGRGGMGVVYEAVQMSLGRRVALKVLPFAAAFDAKQLQRFKNEAQAAAQLHHTNIVPVYAVGEERGVHYYAMQLIDGQNLADLITEMRPPDLSPRSREQSNGASSRADDNGTQPPTGPITAAAPRTRAALAMSTQRASRSSDFYRTVARLGAQAAEALEHAHQLGVIHRDIKPGNLMVDALGNLWVTDFGLAQFRNRAGLTQTGDLLGTLRYMSPEQGAGQGTPLDARTDIYSLGATLYELLTMQPMFDGGDHGRLLRQILYDEPRPLRAVERSIPPELETIILKAVSKTPTDRYATAQEFADDLNRFIENKPIHARRPTFVQRGRKWAQRHPAVVIAAVLICFLTAAGSLTGMGLLENEQGKTKAALDEAKLKAEEAEKQKAIAQDKMRIAGEQEAEATKQANRVRVQFGLARDAIAEMTQILEQELVYPGMENARNRYLNAALEYYGQLIEQYRDDPAAQDELAAAKAHAERLRDDLAAMQSAGQFNLLRSDEVLGDLAVKPEARKRIIELNNQLDKQRAESFKKSPFSTPEARQEWFLKQAELAMAQERGFKDILTATQFRRLTQINVQTKGLLAFRDPKIIQKLKLTDEQQAKIRDIEGNGLPPFGGRGGEWGFGRGRGGPPWAGRGFGGDRPPPDRGGSGRSGRGGRGDPGKGSKPPEGMSPEDMEKQRKEIIDRHKKETAEKLKKVLDLLKPDQLAAWKELTGEPFGDLWELQGNPFGGPFGPGGFGRPPGGPSGPGGSAGGPGGPPEE